MAAQRLELPGVCETGLDVYLAAGGALAKRDNRIHIEQNVLDLIDSIPHTQLLLSMPGIYPATATRILMTVGDFSNLESASQLASYAELCPTTNQPGTLINSHAANWANNKKLTNALWQSSFTAIRHHERFQKILRA
ncbi:IS110 family transposase [Corynebacterium durum]|uniref:IS110 family transposase n=1 Tax=Corynebacterium durum TaxID=61592 RepID=UPI0026DB6601|nr:IS110 family transposase [Corynebacterium durum]MDO4651375.1 IS110 family transposase [Corynebacterium durum]